jgi:hypothetical protein
VGISFFSGPTVRPLPLVVKTDYPIILNNINEINPIAMGHILFTDTETMVGMYEFNKANKP